MKTAVISDFQKYIDVNLPIIYINDFDFARVDELIGKVVVTSVPGVIVPYTIINLLLKTTNNRISCITTFITRITNVHRS